MRNETGGASQQHDEDIKSRSGMPENLNGKQCPTDRTDNGMDGVPC